MTWTPPPPRAGHPYYMHDAIYAQPGALRLVTRGQGDLIAGAASRLRAMDRVLLSGIGTSWHATLVGELLLAHVARLGHRVRALHSFEFKGYWPDPDARTGVVVVSHRGSKRYSVEALAKARAGGGVGVAITGKGAEGLASADYVLRTVDQERSAAHTVSYTTALALLPRSLPRSATTTTSRTRWTRFPISSRCCSDRSRGPSWPHASPTAGDIGLWEAGPTRPRPTRRR